VPDMPDPMPELDKDTAEYNPIMGTHRRRYGSLHQAANGKNHLILDVCLVI
jgi:hypothetical protein